MLSSSVEVRGTKKKSNFVDQYNGSCGLWLDFHSGGPGSVRGNSMWDLWRTTSNRKRFPPSTSVFPCKYHAANAPYSFIYHRRYTISFYDAVSC